MDVNTKIIPDTQTFTLRTEQISSLPIINHFIRRIGVDSILSSYVSPGASRTNVPPAKALGVLVRNLLLSRVPIYSQQEWAQRMAPDLLGLTPEQVNRLVDDRTGRALDRLYDADRATMLTEVVIKTVQEFGISLKEIHTDSTSVTFFGNYPMARGRVIRGKKALAIGFGNNKDHRPDLRQLVYVLTTSADGAVPIYFRPADGNTSDKKIHVDTWNAVGELAGRTDFLYVADSALCTDDNMSYINFRGGRFLTVLPATRKEDKFFKDWLQTHTPEWEVVLRRNKFVGSTSAPDIWKVVEAPLPSAEGYRIVWVHSSIKANLDKKTRSHRLQKAWLSLEAFRKKLKGPKSRYTNRQAVWTAAENILKVCGAHRWARFEIKEELLPIYRAVDHKGASKKTLYRRRMRPRFDVQWRVDEETIRYDARCDGLFPLITNDHHLSLIKLVTTYKQQPRLEKRYSQLKSSYLVAPMWLKNEARIEALLFLYFLVLLLQALIEREIRRAMKEQGVKSLPLYPEERKCRMPCTERILQVFEGLARNYLQSSGETVKFFPPSLSPFQMTLLQLLEVSQKDFMLPQP